MPSDPLPLSPGWEALLFDLPVPDGVEDPTRIVLERHRHAIEQEARTLARAEVIAEAKAVPLLDTPPGFIRDVDPSLVDYRWRVLAALSRLGERE